MGVSELCPGPMAAMDEGDKVQTIYDGTAPGQEQLHVFKPIGEESLWTAFMEFTGSRHRNKNQDTRKLPYAHWEMAKEG